MAGLAVDRPPIDARVVVSSRLSASLLSWTFGDVGRATWPDIYVLAVVAAGLTAVFLWRAMGLDLLVTSDELASSSGVRPGLFRAAALLATALATSVAVSLVGVVGFVGLIAGHLARLAVGWSARASMGAAALIGAVELMAAHLLGRILIWGTVIPVRITTALVGVPALVALLLLRGLRSRVDGVHFRYRSVKALEDVSFEAERGEVVSIVGPNGSGKTTLLRTVDGMLRPTGGVVYLDGRNVHKMGRND